jgi:hypothetical protein
VYSPPLAEAFAAEEAQSATVFEVRVSHGIFKVISAYEGFDHVTGEFWGAKLVLDKKLAKSQVMLRYRRAQSAKAVMQEPLPSEEKVRSYRKKLRLKGLQTAGPVVR